MKKHYYYEEIDSLIVELHQLSQNLKVDGYLQAANAVNTANDILPLVAIMIALKGKTIKDDNNYERSIT